MRPLPMPPRPAEAPPPLAGDEKLRLGAEMPERLPPAGDWLRLGAEKLGRLLPDAALPPLNDGPPRREPNDGALLLLLLLLEGEPVVLRGEVYIWLRPLPLLLLGVKVLRGMVAPVSPPRRLPMPAEGSVPGRVTVLRVLLSRRPGKTPPLLLPGRLPKAVPLSLRLSFPLLLRLLAGPPLFARLPKLPAGVPVMGGRRAVPNEVALLGLPWKPLPKSPRWKPSRMPWCGPSCPGLGRKSRP